MPPAESQNIFLLQEKQLNTVMGILNLLPFLKKIHKPVNIAEFNGCTVAVDAYCWLHKGSYSCAEKLVLGEKTKGYVYYCMKYIDYMLKNNLKPILVFDGCDLKSKADVEKTRRDGRELYRKKAEQFLAEDKRPEAKECLQRCVNITPQIALQLMSACRDKGVDCIVAPYEADAQLAFLALKGIAQIIVTEDSDLLLYGCDKIIFKMNLLGNGTLIEKSCLNEMLSQKGIYTFEKFRQMCILSGCDYLASLRGIGLMKAYKVLKTARQTDITQILKELPSILKMNIAVPSEYIEGFIKAENTFLYQLVYDPLTRKLCPLNPYPPDIKPEDLEYAGQYLPADLAYQIAIGNIDIYDYKSIAFFDPDTFQPKNAKETVSQHELSIWNKMYRIKGTSSLLTETQDSKADLLSEYGHNKNNSPGTKKVELDDGVDDENSVYTAEEMFNANGSSLSSMSSKLSDEDNSNKVKESLSAANIGKEVSKSNDTSVENIRVMKTKGRNVFTKNNPVNFAVEVKSRHFHTTSLSERCISHKIKPALQTPQSPTQNALQEMFKASFKLQKENGGKKKIPESNGHSSNAKDDEIIISLRGSLNSLKNNPATSQSDKTGSNETYDLKKTSIESSIFHNLQSSFSKANKSGTKLSSSPAFSWSQTPLMIVRRTSNQISTH